MSHITIGKKCTENYPNKIPLVISYNDAKINIIISKETSIKFIKDIIKRKMIELLPYDIKLYHAKTLLDDDDILEHIYPRFKSDDDCLHFSVKK